MGKAKSLGLVGAGKFADSPLSRLLKPGESLGPVKAPSLRVASRIANTLRTGYPVPDYQLFEQCSVILISVPDKSVESTVAELSSSSITWARKAVVLYSSTLDAGKLSPLAAQGAQIGSLSVVPGFEERWLLLEGDKPVQLLLGKFIDFKSRRLTVILPRMKPFLLAALACAGPMLTPLLIAAAAALEKAGISSGQASAIIQKQVEMSARAYLKAGRKAQRASNEITDLVQRLEPADRDLARYLNKSVEIARLVTKVR
jgi:hypothetical protein